MSASVECQKRDFGRRQIAGGESISERKDSAAT